MEYLKHITTEHINETFEAAPNLNAALKQVLKKEAQKGSSLEKFVKYLRKSTGGKKSVSTIIEKYGQEKIAECAVIIRYAFDDAFNDIAEKIVVDYSDDFNATYEHNGESISVTDNDNFSRIVNEVKELTPKELKAREVPCNPFMQFILFDSIFEQAVFVEAEKLLI